MFRVECFIEDKHVAAVHYFFDGKAIDLKIVPVRNAVKAANGKLKSTAATSMLEAIVAKTAKLPAKSVITPPMLQQWLTEAGFSSGSTATATAQAQNAKVLRKTKVRGQYEVVKGAA